MNGHWCEQWEQNLKLWPSREAQRLALEPMMRNHNYCSYCSAPFDVGKRKKWEAMNSLVEKARRW